MTAAHTSPRHDAQDIAKALCMVAVVALHVWRGLVKRGVFAPDSWLAFIDSALLLYCVPLFFALAGYNAYRSLQHTAPRKFIFLRAQTLVPVYLVWGAAQELLRTAIEGTANLWNPLSLLYDAPGQFWFLYALLVYHITAALLHKRPRLWLAAAVTAYLAAPYMPTFPEGLCNGGIYYVIGYFMAQKSPPRSIKTFWKSAFSPWLLAGLYVLSVVVCIRYAINIRHPLAFLPTLLSSLFVARLSFTLEDTKAREGLAYIGRASLAIFALHVIFMAAWRSLLLKLGIGDPYLHFLSGVLIGVGAPLAVYAGLKRFRLLRFAFLGN